MTLATIADITPNGTATALTATAGLGAIWVAITASGTSIRVGDSNVGSGRGVAVATGTTLILPRCSTDQRAYDLSKIYVFGASGADKVSITYGY